MGRAEFYRENKDTERVDFRQHEPYVEEGVGNVSKLKGIVPISKMVARDRTAEAIRASQTKAASPDKVRVPLFFPSFSPRNSPRLPAPLASLLARTPLTGCVPCDWFSELSVWFSELFWNAKRD